jgi:hypothetical protein
MTRLAAYSLFAQTFSRMKARAGGLSLFSLTNAFFSRKAEWPFTDDGLIAESQGHFDQATYQKLAGIVAR